MQYLYSDGDLFYFMDTETFEQLPLNKSQVEDALNFVKENTNATIKARIIINRFTPTT